MWKKKRESGCGRRRGRADVEEEEGEWMWKKRESGCGRRGRVDVEEEEGEWKTEARKRNWMIGKVYATITHAE